MTLPIGKFDISTITGSNGGYFENMANNLLQDILNGGKIDVWSIAGDFATNYAKYITSNTQKLFLGTIGDALSGISLKNIFSSNKSTKEAAPVTAEEKDEYKNIEVKKEDLQNILKTNNIEYSENDFADILDKYETFVKYANLNKLTEKEANITEKICNYAKGLKFFNKEREFAAKIKEGEFEDVETFKNNEVIEAGKDIDNNPQGFIDACRQFGEEYVTVYDDGTKKESAIEVHELVAMQEKFLDRELTKDEKRSAEKSAKNLIKLLDKNNNNAIDSNEAASYLWTMSKLTNEGSNSSTAGEISIKDWICAQDVISNPNSDVKDLFEKTYKNGYEALK